MAFQQEARKCRFFSVILLATAESWRAATRATATDERRCRSTVSNRFNPQMKKWLAYLYVSLGGLLAALGAVFVVMYVWEAIIARSGDPDQSLIFWYLPILFLGLMSGAGGLKLLRRGIKQLGSIRDVSR